MKKQIIIFSLLISILLLLGCSGSNSPYDSSTKGGLSIEGSHFVFVEENGSITMIPTNTYKQNESITFVLMNVGKFERGLDNLHWFDLDMIITDMEGNQLLKEEGILSGNGKADLKDDIAVSPYATYKPTSQVLPGNYIMELTIYDMVNGNEGTISDTFTILAE